MTKNLSFKILLTFVFVLILFSIFFLFPNLISETQAQCDPPCPPGGSLSCPTIVDCRCASNDDCNNNDILVRTRRYSGSYWYTCECSNCGTEDEEWNCVYHDTGCNLSSTEVNPQDPNCEDWELCQGNTGWSACNQTCECAGKCLAEPTNYHPEDGIGPVLSTNAPLPIKLVWDEVGGANSYWYRAWKATSSSTGWKTSDQGDFTAATTTGTTTISEAIPGTEPCALQSTTTYSWKVAPCCSADGTNGTKCKDWDDVSTSTFDTSLAPELVLPEDPDWNSTTQMAMNVPIPVILDWCDVEAAEYYKLQSYIIEGGVENSLGTKKITGTPEEPTDRPNSDWKDLGGFLFHANESYRWEVATCFIEKGLRHCSDYSQKWGFKTTPTLPDESFDLLAPPDDSSPGSAVGLPVILEWTKKTGMNSFAYQITPINPPGAQINGTTVHSNVDLDLNLDTVYEWTAKFCTDHKVQDCRSWVAPKWEFRTTGAPPNLKNPVNGAIDVIIPVNFDWDDVSGAGSYRIQVSKDAAFANIVKEEVISSSEIGVDYPDLEMLINYWWWVQTCAHSDGDPASCGEWSGIRTFRTFQIGVPTNLFPPDGTRIEETRIDLSWDAVPGAKVYQYIIYDPTYNPMDPAKSEVVNKIISSNSVTHLAIEFPEIGIYTWKVQACLDTGCSVTGGWTGPPLQTFDLALIAPPEMRGGLVPCGRTYDDPDTPYWNERERCQIKHIFLLLRNVLDFLLWKVATILLVLILLAAGALFYISMGDTYVIFKVKSLLKSVVIGYLLIFFSWFIINLFLAFLGFKFQFFGHWWEIPF